MRGKSVSIALSVYQNKRGKLVDLVVEVIRKQRGVMISPSIVAQKVSKAIKSGIINKPDYCSQCGRDVRIVAHHSNYNEPYTILWLCDKCHRGKHKNYGGKESSILQEKAKGTYKRNEEIRKLASEGANFAQIARRFSMSRQAIRAIVQKSFVEV